MLDKHFTATTYLLNKKTKSTLLHWHKKIKTWLPPGGHIENNENPEEAARREVEEETGITEFIFIFNQEEKLGKIDERSNQLMLPHHLLEEEIETNHYHLDWIFYGFVETADIEIVFKNTTFKWFDREQIDRENSMFENVKYLAIKGINKFCK